MQRDADTAVLLVSHAGAGERAAVVSAVSILLADGWMVELLVRVSLLLLFSVLLVGEGVTVVR